MIYWKCLLSSLSRFGEKEEHLECGILVASANSVNIPTLVYYLSSPTWLVIIFDNTECTLKDWSLKNDPVRYLMTHQHVKNWRLLQTDQLNGRSYSNVENWSQ